jgi:hypothetical protein
VADGTALSAKSNKNDQKKIKIKVKTGKSYSLLIKKIQEKRKYCVDCRKILAAKYLEFLTNTKKKETKLYCEMLWSIKLVLKRCQNPWK